MQKVIKDDEMLLYKTAIFS